MFIIEGKYNKVEIYADSLDSQATGVVKKFCDTEDFKDSVMVLMPDAHAGKGCPIGTTLVSFDFVIPQICWSRYRLWCYFLYCREREKEIKS